MQGESDSQKPNAIDEVIEVHKAWNAISRAFSLLHLASRGGCPCWPSKFADVCPTLAASTSLLSMHSCCCSHLPTQAELTGWLRLARGRIKHRRQWGAAANCREA